MQSIYTYRYYKNGRKQIKSRFLVFFSRVRLSAASLADRDGEGIYPVRGDDADDVCDACGDYRNDVRLCDARGDRDDGTSCCR